MRILLDLNEAAKAIEYFLIQKRLYNTTGWAVETVFNEDSVCVTFTPPVEVEAIK